MIWTGKNGKLSFLDVEVSRYQETFMAMAYRKPTFSGTCNDFDSLLPTVHKFSCDVHSNVPLF